MKKHASLVLLALLLGSPTPSLRAAVPPLEAAPLEETAETSGEAALPTESEEAPEAAPAKIDINALDPVEPSRRDEGEETSTPESGVPDTALVEETAPVVPKKGGSELLRQRIRIRELKTLISCDSAVEAELERARRTRTPEGWRTAMRNYYTLFYKKIVAQDASLKEPLEEELKRKLTALEQHRIYPSTLIEAIPELPGSHSADYAKEAVVVEKKNIGTRPLVDDSDPRR